MLSQRLIVLITSLLCLWQAALAAPLMESSLESRDSDSNTVYFEINLTLEDVDVVGATKQTILMNGQSPGPLLQMELGQSVQFTVHNNMPMETTVHFHGITQLGTPWNDGVPGLSQSPIEPGCTYIYRWTADLIGTFFYHAHLQGQISDGLSGPIVVLPHEGDPSPFSAISSSQADIDQMEAAMRNPKPIVLSDWSRISFEEIFAIEQASGVDIYCPETIIVNGKGSVNCPGQAYINQFVSPTVVQVLNGSQYTAKGCIPPLAVVQGPYPKNFSALPPTAFDVCQPTTGSIETIEVDPAAGWASLNFISTSGVDAFNIAIDQHQMYIYSVDGRYVVPQLVDQVGIANGFRYSAMVKLDQAPGDYTIRVNVNGLNQIMEAQAVLSYKGCTHTNNSTSKVNYAGVNITSDFVAFNEAVVIPFEPVAPSQTADQTVIFDIGQYQQSWQWTMSGNEPFEESHEDDAPPLIFNPNSGIGNDPNLVVRTKNGTWVDLILKSTDTHAPPHPIHKHGSKFFVIGQGVGDFPYATVEEAMQSIPESFNLQNPQHRDGYTTLPTAVTGPTWLALRYQVIQPGAFLLHCHIQLHLSGGMNFVMLDGIDAWPQVPPEYQDGRGGK